MRAYIDIRHGCAKQPWPVRNVERSGRFLKRGMKDAVRSGLPIWKVDSDEQAWLGLPDFLTAITKLAC